jgi:hypothetical protein
MNTSKFIFSVALLLVGPWASAQQQGSACALTGAEVSAALGDTFDEGKPGLEIPGAAMVMRDCRYKSKNMSLMLKTTRYSAAADATAAMKSLAGTLRAVPKDPDGAVIQENQGDATSPVVHYARHGVAVELRVLGIYYKDLKTKGADLKRLQDKLVALRRIP